MKQFLKSVFTITLLLSSLGVCPQSLAVSRGCATPISTVGSVTTSTVTSCNTNFCNGSGSSSCAESCNTSRSCSSSCESSSDRSRDTSCDGCIPCRTGFHYRSQGANTARELVGWQWDLYRPYICDNYAVDYIAFEYQRSFKSRHISQALFGGETLTFAGSLVANRPACALVADNFGLSRTFQGSIRLRPRIENYIVDLGFYIGLDCWCPGLFIRLHAPIVHTRWKLRSECASNDCCDFVCSSTLNTAPFDPCYVSSTPSSSGMITTPGQLPASTTVVPGTFAAAVTNAAAASSIEQALSGNFLFGDMKTPWCAGRFDFCAHKRNGLADIDVIVGYNFFNDNCRHFGLYGQAVIPTGQKQGNFFVFDPVVGNGGHFELGVGLTAHTVLWSGECSNLSIWLEGNITHMFRSRQCRLFDFCNGGFLSRYLLLKEFDVNGTVATYNGNLISATCFNNRKVDVKINAKGDASFKLAYRWCAFGLDIGYNIYGHSHEKIRRLCQRDDDDDSSEICNIDSRFFGIKGTEGVCCFNYPIVDVTPLVPGATSTPTVFPAGTVLDSLLGSTFTTPTGCPTLTLTTPLAVTAVPNNGTQPNATAFTVVSSLTPTIASTDCNVCLASNSNQVLSATPVSSLTAANGFIIANTSMPSFVSINDLNLRSAESPAYLTHKIFAHVNWTLPDIGSCTTNIGVGGEAEFTGRRRVGNNCRRIGVNQWGVWIKGSMYF
jgi:hypothetical protein